MLLGFGVWGLGISFRRSHSDNPGEAYAKLLRGLRSVGLQLVAARMLLPAVP